MSSLVSVLDIKTLVPDQDNAEAWTWINSELSRFNNDLYLITESYPYYILKYNLDHDLYYTDSIESAKQNPIKIYWNYFHYLYWNANINRINQLCSIGISLSDAKNKIREEDKMAHYPISTSSPEYFAITQYKNLENTIIDMRQKGYSPEYINRYAANENNNIVMQLNQMRGYMDYNQSHQKAAYTANVTNNGIPNFDYTKLGCLPPVRPQCHPNSGVSYYQPYSPLNMCSYTKSGEQIYDFGKMANMAAQTYYPQQSYPYMMGGYPNQDFLVDPDAYTFEVTVTENDKVIMQYGKRPEEPPKETNDHPIRNENIPISVCLVSTNEDGSVSYSGNDDIYINHIIEEDEKKKKTKANTNEDYKEIALKMKAQEQETLFLALCKLMKSTGDKSIGDELMWARNNLVKDQFYALVRECISKLKKFRQNNPNINVPDIDINSNNEFIINRPEETEEERQFLDDKMKTANQFFAGLKGMHDKSKEEEKIIKTSEDLVRKIQSNPNVIFYNSEEEYQNYLDWKIQRDKQYNPMQLSSKNKYMLYKLMMKTQCPPGEDYDKWFDEWWNRPQKMIKENPKLIIDERNKYYRAVRKDQLDKMVPTDPEKSRNMLMNNLSNELQKFTQGLVPKDQSLNDFLNGKYGLGYLLHRCGEMQLQRHLSSVRRYWNPQQFVNNMRTGFYNTQLAAQNNIPYDTITSTEAYNNRRQAFINSIFRKNQLGYVSS